MHLVRTRRRTEYGLCRAGGMGIGPTDISQTVVFDVAPRSFLPTATVPPALRSWSADPYYPPRAAAAPKAGPSSIPLRAYGCLSCSAESRSRRRRPGRWRLILVDTPLPGERRRLSGPQASSGRRGLLPRLPARPGLS
jgi:hypothetical protein